MTSGESPEGKSFPPNPGSSFGYGGSELIVPTQDIDSSQDTIAAEPLTRLGPLTELPEYIRLTHGMSVSPELAKAAQTDPAIEAKKTFCSVVCFNHIYYGGDNAYEQLTRPQSKPLLREQFNADHDELRELLQAPADLVTLKYIVLVHDGGKSEALVADMGLTGKGINHDSIIDMVFNDPHYLAIRKRYFPTFDKLDAEQQYTVRRVLGIRFNYAQAYQGEAPAAMYAEWPSYLEPKIDGMAKWEAKLDVAGVLGHVNQYSSFTYNAQTHNNMKLLDAALDEPGLTPVERQKMYLFGRLRAYNVPEAYLDDPANEAELIAVARMACQLRLETEDDFAFLHQRFNRLPAAVTTIIIEELNKTGINDAAALAEYSPAMLAALLKAYDSGFAVPFAQFLQEIAVANAESGSKTVRGIVAAELGALVTKLNTNQNTNLNVRFVRKAEAFVPRELQPGLRSIEGLPHFDGEHLRGKSILILTRSGGDALSGYLTAKLLQHKYNAHISAIAVTRTATRENPKRIVNAQAWRPKGVPWQKLTPHTFRKQGDWRFSEMGILQDPDAPPVYWTTIRPFEGGDPHIGFESDDTSNIERLMERFGPDYTIGIDPGFDSGWTEAEVQNGETGSPHLLTALDHQLIRYLGRGDADRQVFRERHADETRNYMVIPTPGLYGPPDSLDRVHAMGGAVIEQDAGDSYQLVKALARLGMMGTPNREIYSTTMAVQKAALLEQFGMQAIELPERARRENWRAFFDITPAMKEFVIIPARNHWKAISSADSPYGSAY